MQCYRCKEETNHLFGVNSELICLDCKNGPKRCTDCRKTFRESKRGASVFTKEKKGWFCWDCITKYNGYNGFGSGVWDDKGRNWQICTVTFEEVTDDSDLKFVKTFEEKKPENLVISTAIRKFLIKCSDCRWTDAYVIAAAPLQRASSPAGLYYQAKALGILTYDWSEWPEIEVYNRNAMARGYFASKHGGRVPLKVMLTLETDFPEGDTWKVSAFGEDND